MAEIEENISNQEELVNPFLSEEEMSSEENVVPVADEGEESEPEMEEEEDSAFKTRVKAITSSVRMAFTGEFLQNFSESRAFTFMMVIVILFIINIALLFLSFRMINNSENLAQEVEILKNKSTLLHEQYLRVTSQSAIREEVERRHIKLVEPNDPQKKY